jgi:hypothetical protein
MNWQRWNWLDGLILPVTLAVMRVCTLWLWLVLIQRLALPSHEGILLSARVMIAVLLTSLFFSRWSVRWIRPLNRARVVVAVAGLLILFLLLWARLYQADYALWNIAWLRTWGQEVLFWQDELPAAYPLMFAVIYLWLRGIVDGSYALSHRSALSAFIGGCVSLVFFLLMITLDIQPPPEAASPLIFLFFATSLVALSFSSLKRGRSQGVLLSAINDKLYLNRYWMSSSLGVVALLLIVGLMLSAVIAPGSLQQLLTWLGQGLLELFILLIKVVSLLLYPLLWLISWVLSTGIPMLLSRQQETSNFSGETEPLRPGDFSERVEPAIQQLPPEVRWLALGLALLMIAFLFAIILRRLRDDGNDDIRETREFILSKALLLSQLSQLRPSWLNPSSLSLLLLPLSGEGDTRRTIRALYQQLLTAAHKQGWPRPKDQTPVEYGEQLAPHFDQRDDALAQLTRHYHQARYGQQPPTAAQVADAAAAWAQLEKNSTPKGESL